MNPFASLRDYEHFVYTLRQQFQGIIRSTLVVAQGGRLFAELTGEIAFASGHRLVVYERLSWESGPLTIEGYSYLFFAPYPGLSRPGKLVNSILTTANRASEPV
jgi:hypothetical protein